ncbi:MAG: septum formation protein Maf [Clostridiales bacterium]|jgi:septum formation protein|nr:septum formation protein Maf [Clostridiales bacterium]
MDKKQIILASSSPRRIKMLKENGINPMIISPDIDENLPEGLDLRQSVMFLALKKALYVENLFLETNDLNNIIIAADTIVYCDKIIGKPETKEEAFEILSFLRNKSHWVATGVAILRAGSNVRKAFYELTEVFFKDYKDEDIIEYINTSEPYDKAGGYAIQGSWGKYIDRIIGDLDNVIGFPWSRIEQEMKKI